MASRDLHILNGFGRSLGDSLVGLQALRLAQLHAGMPVPLLVRRHYGRPLVDQIYPLAADFARVRMLADTEPDNATPDDCEVIDLRDFAFDPAFRGMAMIDFFLTRLGLDPQAVPSDEKRNLWLAPRVKTRSPAGLPEAYVLVCPGSSMPLRDMPRAVHRAVLRSIVAHGHIVVTQGGAEDHAGVIAVPPLDRIETLCGLVAGASALVSTDTAMVHLADAFDVPCLAVFTTHRPAWRIRDYPRCSAVHLPVAGLPEALEFARDDSDIEKAAAAWHAGLPAILAALDAVLRASRSVLQT